MTRPAMQLRLLAAAGIAALVLLSSGTLPFTGDGALVSTAHAIIGRPATPMSYAGVARRTTRRAVAVGATAGVVYAPACAQVVNAYGQIVTVCQ